jgi:hypothetical protein
MFGKNYKIFAPSSRSHRKESWNDYTVESYFKKLEKN